MSEFSIEVVRKIEDAKGFWSKDAQNGRDDLGDRRWRQDWKFVMADVFKPSGKWGYRVYLDYTGEDLTHFDGPVMAHSALARATDNGTSEVSFRAIPKGWFMVVLSPPQGYPIVVWDSSVYEDKK